MLDDTAMRLKLLGHVKKNYGSQVAASKVWGISPQQVNNMIKGLTGITQPILDELGYEKVKLVKYRKK
jgi:outer membrane receptor for monomeric catechols